VLPSRSVCRSQFSWATPTSKDAHGPNALPKKGVVHGRRRRCPVAERADARASALGSEVRLANAVPHTGSNSSVWGGVVSLFREREGGKASVPRVGAGRAKNSSARTTSRGGGSLLPLFSPPRPPPFRSVFLCGTKPRFASGGGPPLGFFGGRLSLGSSGVLCSLCSCHELNEDRGSLKESFVTVYSNLSKEFSFNFEIKERKPCTAPSSAPWARRPRRATSPAH